jgi:ribosomal protein L7/L12
VIAMNLVSIVALIIAAAGVLMLVMAPILRHHQESTPAPPVDWGDLRNRMVAQLASGNRIEAVRLYRKRTRSNLREANDYVEDIARDWRVGAL